MRSSSLRTGSHDTEGRHCNPVRTHEPAGATQGHGTRGELQEMGDWARGADRRQSWRLSGLQRDHRGSPKALVTAPVTVLGSQVLTGT